MLHVLIGENSFALEQRLSQLVLHAGQQVEIFEGASMTREQLLSSTMAQSLFADERTIVIKSLSENAELWGELPSWLGLWGELPSWLGSIAEHIHLILVESKPDKRTSTYKWLQKHTDIEQFELWTSHNHNEALAWLEVQATKLKIKLDNKLAQELVQRVGYNQWALYHTLEKLALRGQNSTLTLEDIIDSSTQDSVFELLQSALDGNTPAVLSIIERLKQTEDPYAVFGLLASQVTQVAVLSTTDQSAAQIASETGLHPYSLQKLKPYSKRLGREVISNITNRLAEADRAIKSSDVDVWAVLEQQLLHIAHQ